MMTKALVTKTRKTRTTRSIFLGFPFALATAVAIAACGDGRSGFGAERDDRGPSDGFIDPEGGSPDAAGLDAGVCLSETLRAETVPLAILLLMDRSGSMVGGKWDSARQAMIAFTDTPGSVGSKLGLSVFPPDPGIEEQCVPSLYAPIVPIALIPGNGPAIKEALLTRGTTGTTPMNPAVQGAVDAMRGHLAQNPNEEGVVILVTDGDPEGCGSTVANVSAIAQAAAAETPRIRTFVVGMDGAKFSNLDKIALAGGGAPYAFNASGTGDAGGTTQQQLFDALEKIRAGAMGCEYVVPKPETSKGSIDPDSVEMDFSAGKDAPPQKFKRVPNQESCGTTAGGFYYDNPKNPKRIVLCPASCEAVRKGTSEAKMDVVVGCIKQVN